MLRGIIVALVAVAAAHAAVWPPHLGVNQLKSEQPAPVTTDQALWDEFGFVSATVGDYGAFQATAYRFKDDTGAFAAEKWIAAAQPGVLHVGRYVIVCKGKCPVAKLFEDADLPGVGRHSEPPIIWAYLPPAGLIAGSARYALGPVGLERFAPGIPPAVAAFQYGTEVAIGRYRTARGEEELLIFGFPIPQMARQQFPAMQKLAGAMVKRSGSLVAVIPNPPDTPAADKLLSQINYRAQVAWDEQPPPKVTAQGVAQMILTIFKLAGLLILFCALAGFGYAGILLLRKRLGPENADEAMIVLHLVDR